MSAVVPPATGLMAEVDALKNCLGPDLFHSSSVIGIVKEANTIVGLPTEATLRDQAAELFRQLEIQSVYFKRNDKVVPSLQSTCVAFVLRSAGHYDDDSKEAISELLTAHFLRDCCDALEAPASFTGAAHLPELLDACRVSLSTRPAAAVRSLNELYTAFTLEDGKAVSWTHAISSADRLLCTGLYKREIVGPKLPGPVADSVRQLRKLLQEREPESKASEPVSADGDEISDILLDEEWARIVQLERENRRLG